MRHNALYTILFSGAVCIACAVLVSSAAVSLKEDQLRNAALDKQRNVLFAAGLAQTGENLDASEVQRRFEGIRSVVIELQTGERTGIDPTGFDQAKAAKDPSTSREAPENRASVKRLPEHALVYEIMDGERPSMAVVPIEGYGLWSTLYGFLAVGQDGNTIEGITYYQHGETPGLGGEVDNPKWKSLWPGRKIYGAAGDPVIRVIKGTAGSPADAPHEVDGLTGATITSNGVTSMLDFWLGDSGFKNYLKQFQEGQAL
ncbi:MAG: Na(+)-translocating NADH-quinone reductase subunit C [Acidobacteriia bacterium]|nr:Na(+)-translocating NADH-quinone reductase subunit C [Terriglobia bacterium]MYC68147.1 Na(+)-translocating NADH-quinone reductase subunit C [Terriglobia bacterium]